MREQNWHWQFGKLAQTVGVLVTHPGDAKNRVWAATEHLNGLHPAMVPPSCEADLIWIQSALTKYPESNLYKSALEATYHRTRNSTAVKIAQRIWKMYHQFQFELQQ